MGEVDKSRAVPRAFVTLMGRWLVGGAKAHRSAASLICIGFAVVNFLRLTETKTLGVYFEVSAAIRTTMILDYDKTGWVAWNWIMWLGE